MLFRSELAPAIADMAFSLPLNQVSPPFLADLGWYVIRVEVINNSSNTSLEEARDEIRENISNQKLEQKLADYQAEVEAEHPIEYSAGYEPGSRG